MEGNYLFDPYFLSVTSILIDESSIEEKAKKILSVLERCQKQFEKDFAVEDLKLSTIEDYLYNGKMDYFIKIPKNLPEDSDDIRGHLIDAIAEQRNHKYLSEVAYILSSKLDHLYIYQTSSRNDKVQKDYLGYICQLTQGNNDYPNTLSDVIKFLRYFKSNNARYKNYNKDEVSNYFNEMAEYFKKLEGSEEDAILLKTFNLNDLFIKSPSDITEARMAFLIKTNNNMKLKIE